MFPKAKRILGYFALPILVGDEIVAAIDLKADRDQQKLLIQQWTWVGRGSAPSHKALIERDTLHRFSRFQFDRPQQPRQFGDRGAAMNRVPGGGGFSGGAGEALCQFHPSPRWLTGHRQGGISDIPHLCKRPGRSRARCL